MSIATELEETFEAAGGRGFLHACDIDGDAEVALDADVEVVTASVFKVPVLLELMRQGSAGDVDLRQRVCVPADRRTLGPTGLSVMQDDVDVSLRDLAFMMMSVSDNTATDVIMELIGVDRIASTLESLGFVHTAVPDDCAAILTGLLEDLGTSDDLVGMAEVDRALLDKARALDPARTNRTTPREMTRLLSMIWRDEAAPPEACAQVRRIMALQVWPHRLSSGFGDGIKVAGKTGTLPSVRNEVGVVTYPDGRRYAVAVFTRSDTYVEQQPAMDASIGIAARQAIEFLRGDG
jgi:beta-lactamase class A